MSPRRLAVGVAFLWALALTGCDSGPSGPGSLMGSIQGPEPPAAALVLVTGEGIRDFQPVDGARLFWEPAGSATNSYRVLVIQMGEGSPEFQVQVEDLGSGRPTARVLELADGSNQPVPDTDVDAYQVRFSR